MIAAGFVAAGGSSSRMGRDKALLPWTQGTLLDHALRRLREACAEVFILSGSRRRYEDRGVPVLEDAVPGAGPLGGLLTALEQSPCELLLLLAVDMPFVTPALLRRLLRRAEGGADVVVPVAAGGDQPLCAVYRRTCAAAVRRRLDAGQLRMTSFWPEVRVRRVGADEMADLGDPDILLRNLNTLKDYEESWARPG